MQELKKDLYLIDKAELLQVIMEKKNALWRLCQICCSYPKAEDHFEVTYSFANGYELANYRLIAGRHEEIPSISRVYKAAINYENEMHELWGLNVENIKVDLHDKLYRIDVETPFLEKEEKKDGE